MSEIGTIKPPVLELGQFWRSNNKTYCFKPDCDTCQYEPTCKRKKTKIAVGPGLNVRKAFIANPGYKIVAIDYRGIELRVAAQLSREPVWLRTFQNNGDLHREMAKQCFKIDEPTKEQRSRAKGCNFNNLYLGSSWNLANSSKLSDVEAAFVWESWWNSVPFYKRWVDQQFQFAVQFGYTTTFFGRKRPLKKLLEEVQYLKDSGDSRKAKNKESFIKRSAVNTPIQGTSADLMKIAICRVHSAVDRLNLHDKIKLLNTVHDELVFEIKDDEDFVKNCNMLKEQMCPKFPNWDVPIEVDIEVGDNWAEVQDLADYMEENNLTDSTNEISSEVQDRPMKKDGVVVVFQREMDEVATDRFNLCLLNAHNVPDVVKVPIRIYFQGRGGKPGKLPIRVHEPTLRKQLQSWKNVHILEIDEFKQAIC